MRFKLEKERQQVYQIASISSIECHLEGLLMNNEFLPIGTTIDRWIYDEKFQDGVWTFIDIDLSKYQVKPNALISLRQSAF